MWCDFWTGKWYEGGQTIDAFAPLDRLPLFVPDGGMIVMGKPMRHVGAEADDLRQLYIFPHPNGGHTTFRWIEDDGLSFGYRVGAYTEIEIEMVADAETINLSSHRIHDGYPLPFFDSAVEIILPHQETRPLHSERTLDDWTDANGHSRYQLRV